MPEKTFTFTVEQVKAIFDAGVSRGSEEEASFQCGSRSTGRRYDYLADTVRDIVNEGIAWGAPEYVDIDTVDEWFKENKNVKP